jgi:hypothetical protein
MSVGYSDKIIATFYEKLNEMKVNRKIRKIRKIRKNYIYENLEYIHNVLAQNTNIVLTNDFLSYFMEKAKKIYSMNTYMDELVSNTLCNILRFIKKPNITQEILDIIYKSRGSSENICSLVRIYIKNDGKIPFNRIFEQFNRNWGNNGDINRYTESFFSHYNENENKETWKQLFAGILDRIEWIKYIEDDEENIDYVFEYDLKRLAQLLIEKKIKLKDKYIDFAIINNNRNLLDKLLSVHEIPYTIDHLRLACRHSDLTIIKDILDQKIEPDAECFENALKKLNCQVSIRQDIIKEYENNNMNTYDRKRYINTELEIILKIIADNKPRFVILMDYGYVITKENLLTLTKQRVLIDERYIPRDFFDDIAFKEEITRECNKHNMYAYGIKSDKQGLVSHIKSNPGLKSVQKYVKDTGITPDIECLKEACKIPNNLSVIKWMIEKYNVTPDSDCLREVCIHSNSTNVINYISEKSNQKLDSNLLLDCIIHTVKSNEQLKFIATEMQKVLNEAKS